MAPRLRLKLGLIPSPLWKFNLRSSTYGLGPQRWKTLRRRIVTDSGEHCAICGSSEKPQGHEVWSYKEGKTRGKATLIRVEVSCWSCHAIAHWGNTKRLIASGKISHESHM